MHHFKYKNKRLYCENVDIQSIADKVGTPFYLYSHKALIDHYRKIKEAFKSIEPIICFSMKSNSNLSVCKALVKAGSGLDIVSGGELFKAKKIGVNPKKIVYASVGKTASEIRDAINAGILFFNVESTSGLVLIEKVCMKLKKRARIAIRVNPGVKANTHKYITTGTKENKFGIDEDTAVKIFLNRHKFKYLDVVGIHIHIGSQIIEKAPFIKAIKKATSLIKYIRSKGVSVEYLNIGGGLGIVYGDEKPQTAKEFAKAAVPFLKKLKVKVILEPGRFISGNSGILVTRIVYVKEAQAKNFIITDSAMNDLMRPSLYNAYHKILPIDKASIKVNKKKFDVVGPICESGDFLAKDRVLSLVKEGDLLAVMSAGAYGFSMSSNYNSRPRVAEAMVINGKTFVTKKRESYQDLIKGEVVPEVLQ